MARRFCWGAKPSATKAALFALALKRLAMQSVKRADDLESRLFGRLSQRESARVQRLAAELTERRASYGRSPASVNQASKEAAPK
jgi:hypothetical protein